MTTLFDLVKVSSNLKLLGPTGDDLNCTLKVQGMTVPAIKQKALEANAYVINAGKTDDAVKFAKLLGSAEDCAAEMAGTAVIGWDNDELMGGSYTPSYAKELLKRPELDFLRKQVNEFVSDQQNWFCPSAGVVSANVAVATDS